MLQGALAVGGAVQAVGCPMGKGDCTYALSHRVTLTWETLVRC